MLIKGARQDRPAPDTPSLNAYDGSVCVEQTLPSKTQIDAAAGDAPKLGPLLDALIHGVHRGDPAAMERLIYAIDSQRLAEPAIRRILFEPADVADVSQDVLIAVAEKLATFRGESQFSTWLFGVARNKALEFLRRKQENAEFRIELGDTERISSIIVGDMAVQRLLEELPDHYRLPVLLRDVHGLSYADIAETLHLKLNTVRVQISRGRALVAAKVASEATQ